MRHTKRDSRPAPLLGLAATLLLAAAPARGATYSLTAGTVTVTMPNGTAGGDPVTMWGFGLTGGAPTVPGPGLVVPPGDTSLTITLTNTLPEPVSIVIPGQIATMTPVFFTDATGRRRVRSFTSEAVPGGSQTYTWTGLKAGTYLYQSGSHPGVQVQMGLYGSLGVQPAAGQVYVGVPYDKEVIVLVSEVDPVLHAAVAAGRYGQPVPASPPPGLTAADYPSSPIDYLPRYFLVNGTPHTPATAPIATGTGGLPLLTNDRILLRTLNAGLRTHVLELVAPNTTTGGASPYVTLLAEDGNVYAHSRSSYTIPLPAGKTADALLTAGTAGVYPVTDRTLHLTNAAVVADGGMQTALSIGAGGAGAPLASPDSYAMSGNTILTVAAPGVLGNDTPSGVTARLATSPIHGALTLNTDGSFSYTPAAGFAGTDAFTYQAGSGGAFSAAATVTITVSLPPVAANDAYTAIVATTLTITAPGVLGNDTSPGGLALTAAVATPLPAGSGTLTLNANGGFTYTAPATAGTYSFTYTASNGTLTSAPATVTLTVSSPTPPTAAADSFTSTATPAAPSLTVVAPGVLANDTSPGGLPLTAILGTTTTKGTLTLNANGSFTYWTTNTSATTDSFTYRASNGSAQSALATVTITITAHPKPVANDDTVSAPRRTTTTYTPVVINVLANDSATPPCVLVPGTVTRLSTPSRGGTATVNADGTFRYAPPRLFTGTDVFTYSVKDNLNSTSNTGTVRVNVK